MSKFKPGISANPNGRPKGTINKSTALLRGLEGDLPSLLDVTKQLALAGDTVALRLLLDRALPTRKASAALVEIPTLADAVTLSDKAAAVLEAVASGELPPDLGAQLIAALGSVARITEVDDLTRRVNALEAGHV